MPRRKCAKGAGGVRAGPGPRCGREMAGRTTGAGNPPRKDMPWPPPRPPPPPPPPLAEVSTGAAISPIAIMARKPATIRTVIAMLLRTALLLQAARVLPSGKPAMNSRGILERALVLENRKPPCADEDRGS